MTLSLWAAFTSYIPRCRAAGRSVARPSNAVAFHPVGLTPPE